MVKRYPYTGQFQWKDAGSRDDDGILTEGQNHTLDVSCNLNPKSTNWMITESGIKVHHSGEVYCSLFSEVIPEGANFTILGKTYKVLRIMKFQKHVKVWV